MTNECTDATIIAVIRSTRLIEGTTKKSSRQSDWVKPQSMNRIHRYRWKRPPDRFLISLLAFSLLPGVFWRFNCHQALDQVESYTWHLLLTLEQLFHPRVNHFIQFDSSDWSLAFLLVFSWEPTPVLLNTSAWHTETVGSWTASSQVNNRITNFRIYDW